MKTVHVDVAGPNEASMGGSLYLIVCSASRSTRPYETKTSEIITCVQKFIADITTWGGRPTSARTTVGISSADVTSTTSLLLGRTTERAYRECDLDHYEG